MNDWLNIASNKFPDKIGIISGDRIYTYKQINEIVDKIVNTSFFRNYQKQEKIAILSEVSVEFILIIHAFIRYNLVLVPLNTRLSDAELSWQLNYLKIDNLFVSKDNVDRIKEYNSNKVIIENIFIKALNYEEKRDDKQFGIENTISLDLETTHAMIFTSGTTGRPKPAIISYTNILSSARASAKRTPIFSDDRWLLTIPLYHIGGLSIIHRSCIYGIGVVVSKKFNSHNICNIVKAYRVTIISLVPPMLRKIISDINFQGFEESLRIILLGGARTDEELVKICIEKKIPIVQTYGLTEASSQVATALINQFYQKLTTVGKPLDGIELKIVDENGKMTKENEIGEIIIKGEMVISGYFGITSPNFLDNGWFRTGDHGYLDKDNDLFIVSRLSEIIISGGENIYPIEVENNLQSHPNIVENCVIGVHDETWGQIPVAVIVTNSPITDEDIITYLKPSLASFKIPKRIIFVDRSIGIPKTASGKIDKHKVMQLLGNYNRKDI